MKMEHLKGQTIHRKGTRRDRARRTDSSSQAMRQGDGGESVRDGDVTVNQHFPFLPSGPHVAHRHSRTWRGTVWRTAAMRRATRPTANMTSREDTMLTRLSMTCWTWLYPPMFASCQTKVRKSLLVRARVQLWSMFCPFGDKDGGFLSVFIQLEHLLRCIMPIARCARMSITIFVFDVLLGQLMWGSLTAKAPLWYRLRQHYWLIVAVSALEVGLTSDVLEWQQLGSQR